MGIHDEAKLDVKFVAFAKQMNLYLNHFPKHEKFGLSQAIRCKAYELYGFIVESQKRYQKKTSLTNMDICHEQLRMLLRLAHELGYFAFKEGALPGSGAEKTATHRYLAITRFVRKHSLYTFTQAARCDALESVISILGHARHTASLHHLLTTLKDHHHDLFDRLPPSCRRHHHPHTAPA